MGPGSTASSPAASHAPEQRRKFSRIAAAVADIRRLTFRVEERAGVLFVTHDDFPELLVVVKDRNSILAALDQALRAMLADADCDVGVYMNCQRGGDTIDVIVELRRRED